MSNCNKEVFGYGLVQESVKCTTICLKTLSQRNSISKDGRQLNFKSCKTLKQTENQMRNRKKTKSKIKTTINKTKKFIQK